MQEKSQRNMKATGSAALGGSTKHKAGRPANSKGVVSTEMGKAPKTRKKPGYTRSRQREEAAQVSLTDRMPRTLACFLI